MAESGKSLDEELIVQLRAGNISAMKDIYHRHYGMVNKLVTTSGGAEEDADQIFEESMYVLYSAIRHPEYRSNAKLKIVLYSIARSLWISEQRRRGKSPKRVKNYERYVKVDISSHIDLLKAKGDGFDKIQRSFRILGEACQDVLSEFYFHRKPVDQIAAETSKTVDDIRTQKYRCMQHLKRMIG